MISTAAAAGLRVSAFLTDMSEPLARSAGNALEVREAIAMLRGETSDARLLEVTLALGAEVMILGGLAKDAKAARAALARSITSGGAAERFARMVASLGGPADILEKPDASSGESAARRRCAGAARTASSLRSTRVRSGFAVVMLGGGRTAPDQAVDPAVGLDRLLPLGTAVKKGQPIARVHAADRNGADTAVAAVTRAFSIGDQKPQARPLIERIG